MEPVVRRGQRERWTAWHATAPDDVRATRGFASDEHRADACGAVAVLADNGGRQIKYGARNLGNHLQAGAHYTILLPAARVSASSRLFSPATPSPSDAGPSTSSSARRLPYARLRTSYGASASPLRPAGRVASPPGFRNGLVTAEPIDSFLSRVKSDSILPAPSATEDKGSSAIAAAKPVSSRNRLSRFLSSDPPPVSTMPPVHDVGRQLGRHPLERHPDCVDDDVHGLGQRRSLPRSARR